MKSEIGGNVILTNLRGVGIWEDVLPICLRQQELFTSQMCYFRSTPKIFSGLVDKKVGRSVTFSHFHCVRVWTVNYNFSLRDLKHTKFCINQPFLKTLHFQVWATLRHCGPFGSL